MRQLQKQRKQKQRKQKHRMDCSAAVFKLLPDCPLLWAQYFLEIQSVLHSGRTTYCRFRSAPICRFRSVPRLKAVTSLNRSPFTLSIYQAHPTV